MFRFLATLPLMAALCGCVTARQGDDLPKEKLREDKKSIVLLHTSLHDANCGTIFASLAQPDESGRYVYVRGGSVALRAAFDEKNLPSQLVLPAGDYGIVNLSCSAPYRNRVYNARVVEQGRMFDRSGTVYEKPIATFKVGAGEVVDIGSLRLPSRPVSGSSRREFIGVVTAIPEPFLKNLAEKNPQLYQQRVVRPMMAAIKI